MEIAQNGGINRKRWRQVLDYTNMLTVNALGRMKIAGQSFSLLLISGNHELLQRGYSPMTIRFFMLQSHYASTLDFSNDALNAAQKGYTKLANGLRLIKGYEFPEGIEENPDPKQVEQINKICDNCHHAMNDDFNTALTIGHLFNLVKKVNSIQTGQLELAAIGKETFERMDIYFHQQFWA